LAADRHIEDTQNIPTIPALQLLTDMVHWIADCFNDVAAWMLLNRLQFNADKTELMWFETLRRQHQLPVVVIFIDGPGILPVSTARNLGLYFDSDLYMC
jgi:hypothetical protein